MAAYAPPMLVESHYQPGELETATAGRRLGAYVLDVVIFWLAIPILGWLIWFAIVAPRGQSPGKQILGLYIMRNDATRAGGGFTWVREFLVKWLLFGVLIQGVTAGIGWLIAALWLLWDRDRQCLWDKVTDTHVAYSPQGFCPTTANEMRLSGMEPPSMVRPVPTGPPAVPPAAPPMPQAAPAAPTAPPASAGDGGAIAEQLRELKRLLDEELITQQEYDERRARLVEQL